MKAPWSHCVIGLMTVLMVSPAFAENTRKRKKARKPAAVQKVKAAPAKPTEPAAPCETDAKVETNNNQRSPSSVSDVRAEAEAPCATTNKEWEAMVSLLGGYAVTSSSNDSTQAMRDQAHYNRNGYGGIALDSRFKTYAGLELEGFFGTGGSSATTEVNKISGAVSNNTRKLNQNGFNAALKGQIPIQVSRWQIFPKVGFGYGWLSAKETVTDAKGAETSSKEQVKAPFFLVGIDSEVFPNVLFGIDYAMSLGGSGTLSDGTTDVSTDSASFYRFRVGAYYRFLPSFTAGFQYNRRQLKYTATATTASPSPVEQKEGFDQYLGVVTVNF